MTEPQGTRRVALVLPMRTVLVVGPGRRARPAAMLLVGFFAARMSIGAAG